MSALEEPKGSFEGLKNIPPTFHHHSLFFGFLSTTLGHLRWRPLISLGTLVLPMANPMTNVAWYRLGVRNYSSLTSTHVGGLVGAVVNMP
jgi:hypothetical protein